MGIKGFIKIVTYQTNLEDKNLHHFANKSLLTFVIQCPFFAFLLENKKNQYQGQSSGLLVTGADSCSRGCVFQSQQLDGHVF